MKKTKTATEAELAETWRLTTRRIRQCCQEGLPRLANGNFDLDAANQWRDANIRAAGKIRGDRAYWETRRSKWEAKQAELKYRRERGELIDVDVVAREQERAITHAKNLAQQIPDRLMGLLPKTVGAKAKKDVRDSISEMIEDFLFALSDSEVATINDDANGAGDSEAAEVGGVATDPQDAHAPVVRGKHQAPRRNKQQPRKVRP